VYRKSRDMINSEMENNADVRPRFRSKRQRNRPPGTQDARTRDETAQSEMSDKCERDEVSSAEG
jgi:hypothetical protein